MDHSLSFCSTNNQTCLAKTVSLPFQTNADPDFEGAKQLRTASPNLTELRTASPDLPEFPKAVKADDSDETVMVKVKKEKVALLPKGRRRRLMKKQEYVERENMSVPIQEVY